MANVIIKSEERKQHERYVMRSFGADSRSAETREAAACIAAKSREAVAELKKMEGKKV